MKVPFFNYQALFKNDEEALLGVMKDVCSRGAYILQRDLEEFEANVSEFMGVKHVIGVANGTDGLILALRAAGIQEGDEVIMPTHTYIATAASVHYTGGTPIGIDILPDHMMDPAKIESAITSKTKFIMPVQVNGRVCEMDPIMEIAKKHNLTVIEDAAQALGAKYKGKASGTFGAAGMFSLYPAKVLGCYGDGGLVVTNDDKIATQVKLLRDHGRNEEGEVVAWGLNSRLDNLHAAVLNHKLKTYPQDIVRRREIASLYQEGLGDLTELNLPAAPDNGDHFDVFQNYEMEADRRDDLKKYLGDKGIGTIVQWAGTLIHQFDKLGIKGDSPKADAMNERFLMLPMHTALTNDDVSFVIDNVRNFYKG